MSNLRFSNVLINCRIRELLKEVNVELLEARDGDPTNNRSTMTMARTIGDYISLQGKLSSSPH
jgi:hypothetical protein